MTKCLLAQGWTVIEEVQGPMPAPGVGAYSRQLDDGFSVVAIFPSKPEELRPEADNESLAPRPPSGRPALHAARRVDASGLIVVGRLGVSYEPADALIHACTGSRAAGIVLNAPFVSVTASGTSSLHDAEDQLARFAGTMRCPSRVATRISTASSRRCVRVWPSRSPVKQAPGTCLWASTLTALSDPCRVRSGTHPSAARTRGPTR